MGDNFIPRISVNNATNSNQIPLSNGNPESMSDAARSKASYDVVADYLIVGTGPAGAALACFLAQHGKEESKRFSTIDMICYE